MRKRFIYLFIAILALTIFLPSTQAEHIRDESSYVIRPVGHWFVTRNSVLNRWYRNLNQLGSLRSDKENLQKQVLSLQQQLSQQEQIRKENEVLHQELNIPETRRQLPQVLGNIILHGNNPLDQTFLIDIGTNQGVDIGQAVLSQGYLVGRIVEVHKHTSLVRTVVSKKSVVQVWLSETRQKGLLIGDGNTTYLSNIDQGTEVASHSLIETSGLGNSLPQGLLIGTSGSRQSRPNDLSQKFLVEQPVDISATIFVFVITTTKS